MVIFDFKKIKESKVKNKNNQQNEKTNLLFEKIKEDYKDGTIHDMIILTRSKSKDSEDYYIEYHWFGNSNLTTAIGILEFGKMLLYKKEADDD